MIMKTKRILFIYKWATMGGVERVILNRAQALNSFDQKVHCDVHFLSDLGGKFHFINFIKKKEISNLTVVEDIIMDQYDLFFSIDTPEVLNFIPHDKLFIECHTSYKKNRRYLRDLPNDIKGVLVPTTFLKAEVKNEVPQYLRNKVYCLANDVVLNGDCINNNVAKIYTRIPILYLGRIDRMKNVEELIKLVSFYNSIKDTLILILTGEIIEHEINLESILKKNNMISRTIYLPPIRFDRTGELLSLIKNHNGLFMSASLNESFGLSAGEAMACEVPVLLLENSAHGNLVCNDDNYLFKPSDYIETSKKIDRIISNYGYHQIMMKKYSSRLKGQFIKDWLRLINPLLASEVSNEKK